MWSDASFAVKLRPFGKKNAFCGMSKEVTLTYWYEYVGKLGSRSILIWIGDKLCTIGISYSYEAWRRFASRNQAKYLD